MNFELNEDQILFRDTVERYFQENYSFEQRASIVSSEEPFSEEAWAQAAELGWLALPVPEELGGFGGSSIDLMVLFEQVGRNLVLEPFLESLVLSGGVLSRVQSELSSGEIAALIAGEKQFAFAHQESKSPYSLTQVDTVAHEVPDGYQLSGTKAAIYNAPSANAHIVTAMLGDDLAIFLVPVAVDGLSIRSYATVDDRIAADLTLAGAHVDPAGLLAVGDRAREVLRQVNDDALVCVAAEKLGMMKAVLDITMDYTKQRHQFGVPLSSFQVLQHRMADMYVAIEMTTSLLYAAAIKVRDQAHDASAFAAAVKVKADNCAKQVCFSGFQLHGGIATTAEYPVGHYLKRNTVLESFFGGRGHQLEQYKELASPRDEVVNG